MRYFVGFLIFILGSLFLAQFVKGRNDPSKDSRPVLRVFGPSSFISQWGPGPWLKANFEKTCQCRVEFVDGADITIVLQRMKSESRIGADFVLGLDQFDLDSAQQVTEWTAKDFKGINFDESAKAGLTSDFFMPYDWGVLAFVMRPANLKSLPASLDDLLQESWKNQLAVQDPRTSSPGLQFFLWLIQVKGEEQAFQYLKQFNRQVRTYTSSWSTAYGLFQKSQVAGVFSYTTSPIYHQVQDQDNGVSAAEFKEGHPVQFEYFGIPKFCKQCELAKKFGELLLSAEGQKLLMEKNYMFPVVAEVKEATAFARIPPIKQLPIQVPTIFERERLLKKWSQLRRQD